MKKMRLVHTISEVRSQVKEWKSQGLTVGFVPTMGYLHEGHQSLIERTAKENDKVGVSDYVNPMQFGPTEDLASYPRDIERDCGICEKAGANLVFNPDPSEMYAPDFCTFADMTGLTDVLCGKSRPVHFRGVCTVVSKLFNIVAPHRAYFGEKDAQQLAVIRRMVRDLNFDIEIVGCPIIREDDGLAKSSRNTYLSEQERKAALILSRSLELGKKALQDGERDAEKIRKIICDNISTEPLSRIDYVEVSDLFTLERQETIKSDVLVAIAVYIGKTRLIDNFTFNI